MVVKHHRNSGIGAQAFSTGTRREMNAAQVHRERADGTDAVDAQFNVELGAKRFEAGYIVEHAGGGFAVSAPKPAAANVVKHGLDSTKVELASPGELHRFEVEAESASLIDQAIAEFTIADNEATAFFERELPCNDVIGERAGTKQQFDVFGAGQITQCLFRRLEISNESVGAM